MNIKKLVAAAEKIDRLAIKSEARRQAWQQLAHDSKAGLDRQEVERRKQALDAGQVVDFSSAIAELRIALHAN